MFRGDIDNIVGDRVSEFEFRWNTVDEFIDGLTTVDRPAPSPEPTGGVAVSGRVSGDRPDLTLAQIVAAVKVTIGLLAATGIVVLTDTQTDAVLAAVVGLAPVVSAAFLVLGDARIRDARNRTEQASIMYDAPTPDSDED